MTGTLYAQYCREISPPGLHILKMMQQNGSKITLRYNEENHSLPISVGGIQDAHRDNAV